MKRKKAESFDEALEHSTQDRAVRGETDPLVETARQATILGEPPPAPPYQLYPGRRQFLAEAARIKADRMKQRKETGMTRRMKLAAVLMAAILAFGMVFGTGQAAAQSLPGDPLYGLKLTAEEVRGALTSDPQAQADLDLSLAEERMDEVAELLEQGQAIDDSTANRVQEQLAASVQSTLQLGDPAAAGMLQQLAATIQQRHQIMAGAAGETPEAPVRQLLREMERVRQEAHAGQGDPDGLRQRLRHGEPSDPAALPEPNNIPQQHQTPGPHGPYDPEQPGQPPEGEPPGAGPGPQPAEKPGGPNPDQPGEPSGPGQQSPDQPGSGSGQQPANQNGEGSGNGSQPSQGSGQGGSGHGGP